MKAPVIPLVSSNVDVVIDFTPKYPSIRTPAFDYIIIGDQPAVLELTKKILEKTTNESILVILPRPETRIQGLTIYPPQLALLDSAHESFVDRQLVDWICERTCSRRASRTASIFSVRDPADCYLYKIGTNGTANKTKKLKRTIAQIMGVIDRIASDETGSVYDIAIDQLKWAAIAERVYNPVWMDISELSKELSSLCHPRLSVLNDTVIMLNYKVNVVGTRRQRFKFRRSVIYAGAIETIIGSTLSPRHAQAVDAINFFPRLPNSKCAALKEVAIDTSRLVIQVNCPIWKLLKIPTGASVYIRDRSRIHHIVVIGYDICEVIIPNVTDTLEKSELRGELSRVTQTLSKLADSHEIDPPALIGCRIIYAYSKFSAPVMMEEHEESRIAALDEPLCLWENMKGVCRKKVFFMFQGFGLDPNECVTRVLSESQVNGDYQFEESASPLSTFR